MPRSNEIDAGRYGENIVPFFRHFLSSGTYRTIAGKNAPAMLFLIAESISVFYVLFHDF